MSAAGDALVPVRIVSVGDRPRAAWAEGHVVLMPSSVLDRTGWRRSLSTDGDLAVPPEGSEAVTADDVARLREWRAFTDRQPASARMPVSYRVVPGWARAAVATAIGRWNRRRVGYWASFPRWPLDLSTDALDDLRDSRTPAVAGRPAPVVVTHDVDSPEGLAALVDRFLPLEEKAGARSTNYIVPCAWPVDGGLVSEVLARGHSVGVHGFDHANRTPFAGPDERARRLDAGRAFADRYGAVGYRAPSLLRTRALLRDLGSRYRYDSSIPTTGGLFPVPNNGCATARPFVAEGIAELPVTLPRDGSLRFLGYSPDEVLEMWIDCANRIAQARGVVVLLTHCERRFSGSDAMLERYSRFLMYVSQHPKRFAFSQPERALAGAA